MGETTVKYLGHNEGHMISKLEENLGDTDIKNFTVSPLYQIKCIVGLKQGYDDHREDEPFWLRRNFSTHVP